MSEFFHIEKSNILFLRSDMLQNYENIYQRLTGISRDCSGFFDICQGWHPCTSYIGMYISSLDRVKVNKDIISLINDFYFQNIKAYVIILLFTGWIELYDLCIEKEERRKGYAKKIIENTLFLKDSDEKVWLGIDIANPSFELLARFYSKMGFGSPYISNITPNGKLVDLVFIGLFYEPQGNNPEETFQAIMNIRQKFLLQKDICQVNVLIPTHTCAILKEYITKSTEFGGILQKVDQEVVQGLKFSILDYPISSEIQGQNSPLYAVATPIEGPFNWHSHPEICYRDIRFLCFIGWPSGQDMAMTVFSYDQGLRMHFVITVEGIYAVQMTIAFAEAWEKLQNESCRNAIIYGVGKEFGEAEKYRSELLLKKEITEQDILKLFKETQSKYETFFNYLQAANTLTFETLVNSVDRFISDKDFTYVKYIQDCVNQAEITENFTLFHVNFMPWIDIAQNGFISRLYIL
jgi:hypothetical protein